MLFIASSYSAKQWHKQCIEWGSKGNEKKKSFFPSSVFVINCFLYIMVSASGFIEESLLWLLVLQVIVEQEHNIIAVFSDISCLWLISFCLFWSDCQWVSQSYCHLSVLRILFPASKRLSSQSCSWKINTFFPTTYSIDEDERHDIFYCIFLTQERILFRCDFDCLHHTRTTHIKDCFVWLDCLLFKKTTLNSLERQSRGEKTRWAWLRRMIPYCLQSNSVTLVYVVCLKD